MDEPTQSLDEQLLKALGMENLPHDRRQQAIEDILYVLNHRLVKRIADQLSEKQLDEINALSEKPASDHQLRAWFEANVPNYVSLLEEEATRMRDEDQAAVDKVMADYKAGQADQA